MEVKIYQYIHKPDFIVLKGIIHPDEIQSYMARLIETDETIDTMELWIGLFYRANKKPYEYCKVEFHREGIHLIIKWNIEISETMNFTFEIFKHTEKNFESSPCFDFTKYIYKLERNVSEEEKLLCIQERINQEDFLKKNQIFTFVNILYPKNIKAVNKTIYMLLNNPNKLSYKYRELNVYFKKARYDFQKLRVIANIHPLIANHLKQVNKELLQDMKIKFADVYFRRIPLILEKLDEFLSGTKEPYMVLFLDLKKAFDSVNRDYLIHCLIASGLHDYQYIISYLDVCHYNYHVSGYEHVKKEFGLPIGPNISQTLFEIIIYTIINQFKHRFSKVFQYVDDLCIILTGTEKIYNLSSLIPDLSSEFQKAGLYLNIKKSKYLTNIENIEIEGFEGIKGDLYEKYLGKYYFADFDIEKVIPCIEKDVEQKILLMKNYLTSLKTSSLQPCFVFLLDHLKNYQRYLFELYKNYPSNDFQSRISNMIKTIWIKHIPDHEFMI